MGIQIEETPYRGIQRYYHSDWSIEAFNIPRNKIKNKEYPELGIEGHSIYFLYGEDDNEKLRVYVGRSSDTEKNVPIFTRLNQHITKKSESYYDLWDSVIALKFNKLSFDDMRHLENYFFKALLPSIKLNEQEPDTDAYKYADIKHKVEYIKTYVNFILKENVFKVEKKQEAVKDVPRLDYTEDELKNQGKRLIDKDFEKVTEIQTYKDVVDQMLDMLPNSVWGPDTKFLDPACTSGEYLKAIFNRLMESPLYKGTPYENIVRRQNYIFNEQIFGIALSDKSLQLTLKNLENKKANIIKIENIAYILGGYNFLNKTKDVQSLSYNDKKKVNQFLEYLKSQNIKEVQFEGYIRNKFGVEDNMKFNVIIGNPPYQEASKSIHNEFIDTAISLKPDHISMIVKNNWMQSEVLQSTRDNMINSGLKEVIDYPLAKEIFKDASVAVSIFHIANGYTGDTHFREIKNGDITNDYITDLKNASIVLSNLHQQNILTKVKRTIIGNDFGVHTFPAECFRINSNGTVGRKESVYMLDTVDIKDEEHNIAVIYMNSSREPYLKYIKYDDVPSRTELVPKYKVICGSVLSPDKYVLRNLHTVNPMTVATKSWGLLFTTDSYIEAMNVCKYLKTKFARFLIKPFCNPGVNCVSAYRFNNLPSLDFISSNDIDWSTSLTDIDKQLYKKYSLSFEEIKYIEDTINSYDKVKLTKQDGAAALINKLCNK